MTKEEHDSYAEEITVRENMVRNKVIVSSFLNADQSLTSACITDK